MCGQSGLAVSEAMELSPRDFHYYLNGKFNSVEMNNKVLWEIARFNTLYVAAPNWDKKKYGKLTAKKLIEFPWEKDSKREPLSKRLSKERFEEIEKIWSKGQ